jgi:hypothetical protein
VHERQADEPGGEQDESDRRDRSRAEPVDDRAGERRGDNGEAGDAADDEAGDAETEAARLVQVDDFERHQPAPADVVQEEADLDDPQLRGQPVTETAQPTHPALEPPTATTVIDTPPAILL